MQNRKKTTTPEWKDGGKPKNASRLDVLIRNPSGAGSSPSIKREQVYHTLHEIPFVLVCRTTRPNPLDYKQIKNPLSPEWCSRWRQVSPTAASPSPSEGLRFGTNHQTPNHRGSRSHAARLDGGRCRTARCFRRKARTRPLPLRPTAKYR